MQKSYRLKSRASYNYIYRKGQSVAEKNTVLVYHKTQLPPKFGFSVTKKSVTRLPETEFVAF